MTPLAYLKLALVLAGVVGILWVAKALYDYGKATAVLQIERANNAGEDKADSAERGVLACAPGKWDRENRKCRD